MKQKKPALLAESGQCSTFFGVQGRCPRPASWRQVGQPFLYCDRCADKYRRRFVLVRLDQVEAS